MDGVQLRGGKKKYGRESSGEKKNKKNMNTVLMKNVIRSQQPNK